MNLTTKVMATLALVIVVALITATALIERNTGNVYHAYVSDFRQQRLFQAAELASQSYAATASWEAVQVQ